MSVIIYWPFLKYVHHTTLCSSMILSFANMFNCYLPWWMLNNWCKKFIVQWTLSDATMVENNGCLIGKELIQQVMYKNLLPGSYSQACFLLFFANFFCWCFAQITYFTHINAHMYTHKTYQASFCANKKSETQKC